MHYILAVINQLYFVASLDEINYKENEVAEEALKTLY